MSKSKKKGTINSTQDSVKNHLQGNKKKQYSIKSNKLFVVKNIIPNSTIVIKYFNYLFKIK
jgi:hypothetical protein